MPGNWTDRAGEWVCEGERAEGELWASGAGAGFECASTSGRKW